MLDTINLIKKLKLYPCTTFVVGLKLNFGINATHEIYFEDDFVYDTGIDDEQQVWYIHDFLNFYGNAIWEIEQIIH